MQITGAEPESSTVGATVKSFKALHAFADFGAAPVQDDLGAADTGEGAAIDAAGAAGIVPAVKLGYTINLNLPATSDIAVFNAIFRSLREHLLR